MAENQGWIPLSATVRELRSELAQAVEAAQGKDLQFRLGPVELEFQLGVTNEAGADAGIRFWVVSLGAKGSHVNQQTHRLKLTLTPHRISDPDGDVNIAKPGRLGD